MGGARIEAQSCRHSASFGMGVAPDGGLSRDRKQSARHNHAPQTENVADDAHHLSRREVRGGHVFIGMGTREKRLQGFSGRARPVGYVVEAWRIVGKKRPKFLIRSDDMTNVALAERETVAFLHCASMGRLVRARGGGHRAGKHRQKGCPRPAAHAGILQRCSRSALIYINRRAIIYFP